MRHTPYSKKAERSRVKSGKMATSSDSGFNGAFRFWRKGLHLFCIASNELGWEHVSVTLEKEARCPTWEEMCYIKDIFWSPEESVVQYHPHKDAYINNHPYCLHMWRSTRFEIPVPDPLLVGLPGHPKEPGSRIIVPKKQLIITG